MTTKLRATESSADELRDGMVTKLLADRQITQPGVEAAFRAVPRERFAPPGSDLATVYDPYDVVVTKRDADGRAVSSISAASIQAFMIEQARLVPGMRVLEIGSGGYNAALLAEIVGPSGRVVTVDIDPDVTDRAATYLDAHGFGTRVRVLQADGYQGIADEAPFDVILVTVQCWDIAPRWLGQLTAEGTLVLPLTMNGVSRSIAFRRNHDHWISHDARACGFVDLQGEGRHTEHRIVINSHESTPIVVAFDGDAPAGLHLDPDVLAGPAVEAWSGVAYPHATWWGDMYLYFACYLDGFCQLATPDGHRYPPAGSSGFPYATTSGGSIAYLATRPLDDPRDGVEFGAIGFGPEGQKAAARMIGQIQAWDANARSVQPWFTYMPRSTDRLAATPGAVELQKVDGSVVIHWPRNLGRANSPIAE